MAKIEVEERVAKARGLFGSGYNCAQSVAMTFDDLVEVDPSLIAAVASSFGGGLAGMREVCGAVSGASIIVGLLYPVVDTADREAKRVNREMAKGVAESFKSQNGSIVCRELLGLAPCERVKTRRPCEELVCDAVRILSAKLL